MTGWSRATAGRCRRGARVSATCPRRARCSRTSTWPPTSPSASASGAVRPRRRARVEEMLDLVELPRRAAARQPHELSGGQQQRVALARALAPAPDVVLLDEPFSSLDAGLREETGRAVARALRASETTAVLVTHDQGEALSLADQVAVMAGGRFLQVATPTEVYLDPATPAVASFVGLAALVPASATGGIARERARRGCRCAGAPDGPVLLAVRPEQVAVTPRTTPGSLAAEVLEVSFFGHDATVRARVAGPDAPGRGDRAGLGERRAAARGRDRRARGRRGARLPGGRPRERRSRRPAGALAARRCRRRPGAGRGRPGRDLRRAARPRRGGARQAG